MPGSTVHCIHGFSLLSKPWSKPWPKRSGQKPGQKSDQKSGQQFVRKIDLKPLGQVCKTVQETFLKPPKQNIEITNQPIKLYPPAVQ